MSKTKVVIILAALLVIDQVVKILIKANMEIGESITVFPNWFFIHFIENPGAAFGMQLGGDHGKLILSLFRVILSGFLIWYIGRLIKKQAPMGVVVGFGLIFAGAVGNILDSAFYGLIFDTGTVLDPELGAYVGYHGVSQFSCGGYASFLHGCVVDMFHFPIFRGTYPSWFPIVGGDRFTFFSPVFNVADSYISIGVLYLVLFKRKYFK
jgi:signal peptidase II